MKYQLQTKTYVINLDHSEKRRWAEVIASETGIASILARQARDEISDSLQLGPMAERAALAAMNALYKAAGGFYRGELRAWADALRVPLGEMVGLNCLYELAHASDLVLGCTAGVKWTEDKGMVHVRTMDWPLSYIGPATRIFKFMEGSREFSMVGVTGFVGALSGMVPGGYSVTINWAPPEETPGRGYGPMFLLRHVLETCDTYQEAVEMLRDTPLVTSVFYVVCGVKKGEGCIIERTRKDAVVRRLGTKKVLVQANHYQSAKFSPISDAYEETDDEMSLLESSEERQEALERNLKMVIGRNAMTALNKRPVCNEDTHQKMVFCPALGETELYTSMK